MKGSEATKGRPPYEGITMSISVDFSRGVDVMRGKQILRHFDGEGALEAARAYAAEGRGRYLRYWGIKGE